MEQSDHDVLHALVGRYTLVGPGGVLHVLAEICNEKADHVRSAYPDDPGARWWDEVALKIRDLGAP